ncbi:MAG TPA: glycosyltransferase [Longimicrobiales bacterium]|nr:glycosyltransferase [Longimicrobiales bacterium]
MSVVITLLYACAAFLAAAFSFMELRLVWRFLKNRPAIRAMSRRTPEPIGEPRIAPTVTIQIPLYNERTTAAQIVRAAAAQEYPKDRFDIQVLDDSTDETPEIVAAAVEEVRGAGVRIHHVRRGDREGYKAGALAAGLERSDADFVAVFDADFVPEPTFLRRLLVEEGAFDDPTVAFVQARWAWNQPVKGLLSSALALPLDRHFFVQKPTRAFVGNVTTFNGSAGIWRRKAVDEAGGWSASTLTEDLDLSYRCALRGWRGHYLRDVSVANELPGHMSAFKLQQRRWAKGSAQCFRGLAKTVLASKGVLRDRWDEAFLLAGYAIHPILLANVLLWPWAVISMDRLLFLVLQALMGLAMTVVPLSFLVTVTERDGSWALSSVGEILAGLVVGIGLMVNNSVGQLEGFLVAGGEFARTPKGGNARTSRAVAGAPAAKAYANPLHWTFFLEVLLIGYCVAGAGLLFTRGEALWAIPMLFFGMCVGLVVQLQLAPRLA